MSENDLIRFPSSVSSTPSPVSLLSSPNSPSFISQKNHSKTPENTPLNSEYNSHNEDNECEEVKEDSSFASLSTCSSYENSIGDLGDKELLRIGVNSGQFQVSDVLACVISKMKWGNIVTTRSSDNSVLDTCDILFGVGGLYDPKQYRFDYKQNSCKETFDSGSQILLSSAGMSWKYFGKDIVSTFILSGKTSSISDDDMNQFIEYLYSTIYYKYILEIDANDNGVPRLKEEVEPDETENYSFHINLPHIIAKYNYEDTENEFKQLEAFNKAMITVGDIFETLCRQEISYNMDFWRDLQIFEKEFRDPSELPTALNVTKYRKTFRRLVDQFDPQREFVKFVYFNNGKDVWTVKARSVPDQPFVNVIDIPCAYRLGLLFKRDGITENNILFVDKKGRFANASNESTIKNIIKYALEENNRDKNSSYSSSHSTSRSPSRSTKNKDHLSITERLNDKEELKKIGKTALFATTMFGLGFFFAKTVL